MPLATSFHEQIALVPAGRFRYRASAADVGVEPDLLAAIAREGRFCFLDFEATGLNLEEDALIEVGAAAVEPGSADIEIFTTFIHAPRELSPFIRRLTGIRQEDVDGAPSAREVAVELDAFIADAPVVAHNARFEQSWL